MRLHWISAAILSAGLAAGCGDRAQQNAQNQDQNAAAPAGQPAGTAAGDREAVSPDADNSAVRPDTSGSRSTAGTRTAPPRRDTRNDVATRDDRSRTETRNNAASSSSSLARVVREVTVPSGTTLPLELLTALSSETAQVETPVRARLRQSIDVDGRTALPAGTVLTGTVTEVARSGRVQGRSRLAFRFDEATVNGVREDLRTNPVVYEGEATKGEDATKIGAGAGIGAAIGGIIGGGKGAAKGAAIGGAAGTGAVLATRGKEVELAAGTDITATLASDVRVNAR
jgi:hypothetical protein